MELRRRFFRDRIDGYVDPAAQKDTADVAHGFPAEIAICRDCGILVRRETEMPHFESEHYENFTMERLLRAHIRAYRHKARIYRPLLVAGSRVLEVGSYVGGFLHVAAEWGWNAVGVDIGRDTTRFARTHGYAVREGPLEHCRFASHSFDGVFIWNTFEQIEDPKRLLAEVRRILRPGGVLFVRTPNASLYIDRRTTVPILVRSDRHIDPGIRPMTITAKREASRLRNTLRKAWLEATFLHDIPEEASMPEKETIQRARRDKAQGKAPTTQAGEFVREEIEHIREGKHGARSTKQAIAIGLSKARRSGVKLPPPKKASASTREHAKRDLQRAHTKPSPKRARAVRAALKREPRSAASRTALSRQAKTAARRRRMH
jgi:SAM-dependent methyltransferase